MGVDERAPSLWLLLLLVMLLLPKAADPPLVKVGDAKVGGEEAKRDAPPILNNPLLLLPG